MYSDDYKFLLKEVYDYMSADDYKFLLKEIYDNMSANDYTFLLKEVYDNMSTDYYKFLLREVCDNMSTDDFSANICRSLQRSMTVLILKTNHSANFKNQSQRQEGILKNQSQHFMTIFGIMNQYKMLRYSRASLMH